MRGPDLKHNDLFSYTTLEQRIPKDHPLRPLPKLVDADCWGAADGAWHK